MRWLGSPDLPLGIIAALNRRCPEPAVYWGSGGDGVLGNDMAQNTVMPVPVCGGLTFETIISRAAHTCGVPPPGVAYCCEEGTGMLGIGSTDDQSSPAPIAGGLSFTSVTAMDAHTCGVIIRREAHYWRRGEHGVLGNGSTYPETTPPVVVGGLTLHLPDVRRGLSLRHRHRRLGLLLGERARGLARQQLAFVPGSTDACFRRSDFRVP